MNKIIINGGNRLEGDIHIKGAKNAILPILSACIMCEEEVIIRNCAILSDVKHTVKMLELLGCKIEISGDVIKVNAKDVNTSTVDKELSSQMRSSIFILGPLLSRTKKAVAYFPGGCEIGIRPIDLHLKGLSKLNVKICENCGKIECNGSDIIGDQIMLDYPSVGATENLMMAAVLAKGTTYIHNAAREPEIVDLQNFLNAMGARITGSGSSLIVIEGVKKLHGCDYSVISDRIVAGTYMVAGAITCGDVCVKNINPEYLQSIISKITETGCKVDVYDDAVRVKGTGKLKEISSIETAPFPGFPTDMQSQFLALCTVLSGTSMIVENVFENRYMNVPELIKMGASITIKDRLAIIRGVKSLCGNNVYAKDLRGGASLVLAGLSAKGTTVVENAYHIDRGYEDICSDLHSIGADIKRQ